MAFPVIDIPKDIEQNGTTKLLIDTAGALNHYGKKVEEIHTEIIGTRDTPGIRTKIAVLGEKVNTNRKLIFFMLTGITGLVLTTVGLAWSVMAG